MSAHQVAVNAKATRWLADLLEHWEIDNAVDRAEFIARELLDLGLARIPRPVPLHAATPPATDEQRRAHVQRAKEAITAIRRHRQEPTR